jgi:hypothetical protein
MVTELRRADELRISDQVFTAAGSLLTVTSTRLQGVGPGVVSVGFAERPGRLSLRPGEVVSVAIIPVRKAG